jgi:hypothetical protein
MAESADGRSTLAFYRRALRARRRWTADLSGDVGWLATPSGCLGFERRGRSGGRLVTVLNCTGRRRRVDVPPGCEVVLASSRGRVAFDGGAVEVPAESTVWLAA